MHGPRSGPWPEHSQSYTQHVACPVRLPSLCRAVGVACVVARASTVVGLASSRILIVPRYSCTSNTKVSKRIAAVHGEWTPMFCPTP